MFGEKAVELIKELDRAGNILPPYNDENIREVLDEMKVLYNQNHLDVLATQSGAKGLYPTIQWRHCGIERNRRCILAYLYNRLMNIKEIRWEVGGVLPSGVKPSLSVSECKWFQSYNQILASYMRSIDGLVLTQDDKPPKSLFLEVRCLIDYGDFETEDGTQLFLKKGTVHFLPRGEAEQFIREGVVAHVSI